MPKGVGILTLLCNNKKVVWQTLENTIEFEDLNEFLNTKISCGNTKVYLTDTHFNVIYKYLEKEQIKVIGIEKEKKTKKDEKDKKEYSKIFCYSYSNKVFYSLQYKIGSDELSAKISLELIKKLKDSDEKDNCRSGYTSQLRKIIKTEEKKIDTLTKYQCSLSPFLYAKRQREHENVHCWDIISFYPYLLTQELPHFDKIVSNDELDLMNNNYTYYGGIEIIGLKAKSSLLTLSLVGDKNKEIAPNQGENIEHNGTRLMSADKVILYGWLPFIIIALFQDYEFEDYRITPKIWRFELKRDEILREVVLKMFNTKQEKKRLHKINPEISYDGEKVRLNRCYGFFLTTGNDAPTHYGTYIVAKGKMIIRSIAKQIGEKDVIQGHTDSIKFVGKHQDVIDKYNSSIEFDELGKFDYEGDLEKVIYYGVNKAKYLKNGELGLKHGGISDSDIAPLMKMSYDEINRKTKYYLTVDYFYDKELGFRNITKEAVFGGSVDGTKF